MSTLLPAELLPLAPDVTLALIWQLLLQVLVISLGALSIVWASWALLWFAEQRW